MSRLLPNREDLRDVLDVFLRLCVVGCLVLALLVVADFVYDKLYLQQPATGLGGAIIGNGLVAIDVWVSDRCPENGEIVTVRATATNKTIQPQVLELKDQPVFDLGVGIWGTSPTRWSDGKALTPDLTRLELQPGQGKTIQMDWRVADSTTEYYATATLDYSSAFPNAMFNNPDIASATVRFGGWMGCSISIGPS
jgi:hypothetical protein